MFFPCAEFRVGFFEWSSLLSWVCGICRIEFLAASCRGILGTGVSWFVAGRLIVSASSSISVFLIFF